VLVVIHVSLMLIADIHCAWPYRSSTWILPALSLIVAIEMLLWHINTRC